MSKLTEDFKKVDKSVNKRGALYLQKEMFEQEFKDNEVLKNYLKLLKEIEKENKYLDESKTFLYEGMIEENIDDLNGKFCSVSLKRPYEKVDFDTKQFLKDYKPSDKLYKKYVNIKNVKGNITLKVLED